MFRIRSLLMGACAASALLLIGYTGISAMVPEGTAVNQPSQYGFEYVPPVVDAMSLQSQKPDALGHNAILSVVYARGQSLPDSIPLTLGEGERVSLVRNQAGSNEYKARITFDFARFVEEQSKRKELSDTLKPTVLVFNGREVVGRRPLAFIDPGRLLDMIETGSPIRIPGDIFSGVSHLISAPRSLMVTHPLVVEDPTRTFDVCTGAGNPNGAWTFNTLMTDMANQPATGVDPSDFVENWMQSWGSPATVNTFAVNPRPAVISQILGNWPRLASGKLDLSRSPMRLLAIVNRVDLRTNSAYGGGSGGEGRFVFGVLRKPIGGGSCTAPLFTVILEYGVPMRTCPTVRAYGQQWDALGSLALGSPAYNTALQNITDVFAAANAHPSKPNGSAINQIRTNEFLNSPWELREFQVRSDHQLHMASTQMTPHHTRNNTPLMANYVNTMPLTLPVPNTFAGTPFLTGSSLNFGTSPSDVWRHPGITDNDDRNAFSLETCNACHGGETVPVTPASPINPFLHIAPRNAGSQAGLSRFLVGSGSLTSPTLYLMADPVVPSTMREYGDLVRRQTDLATLVSNACPSGGVLGELHALNITTLALATH